VSRARAGGSPIERRVVRALCALCAVAAATGRARADEPIRQRPAVRLELGACLDPERDAIQRAVRIELGQEPRADEDPGSVAVRVDCAAGDPEAGVILEVRRPGSARRYRYALDWRAQPGDVRPRLLGLAVAEAVDASQLELIAVPEPPVLAAAPGATRPSLTAPSWNLAFVGGRRSFAADTGVALVGAGLMPSWRLSPHLGLSMDALGESSTIVVPSGAIQIVSASTAPRIAWRVGARLHAELGAGVRLGVVRMRGEAFAPAETTASRLIRVWFGPIASAAVGFELTPRVSLRAGVELGEVVTGATARDQGRTVAVLDGAWTSFTLAATVAL